ncbi:MAG: hypothetical protein VKJ02_08800 [Snowella sp.]|nr:hypothetical protein [Snowella sp.]
MSITILKEGDTVRLLQSDIQIPEGEPIILFTKEEMIQQIQDEWVNLQMPSFVRDDEDEDGEELF